MTTKADPAETIRKIVVSFDICSSTSIIEDLDNTENTKAWRDFLIWIKNYLIIKSKKYNFNMYKFTGDGWILLFENNCKGDDIVEFLDNFCKQFGMRYVKYIEDHLDTPPSLTGITFGISEGSLIKFVMNKQDEYVGRALNVACRLQGAIKDKDKKPQYKALITKHLFKKIKNSFAEHKVQEVTRILRNISDGKEVHCVKIWLNQ
jgi:hypothetical protein